MWTSKSMCTSTKIRMQPRSTSRSCYGPRIRCGNDNRRSWRNGRSRDNCRRVSCKRCWWSWSTRRRKRSLDIVDNHNGRSHRNIIPNFLICCMNGILETRTENDERACKNEFLHQQHALCENVVLAYLCSSSWMGCDVLPCLNMICGCLSSIFPSVCLMCS